MITIRIAGLRVGVDNQYDLHPWLDAFAVSGPPDFTVRVAPEELAAEAAFGQNDPAYLEYVCAYRAIARRLPSYEAFVFHGAVVVRKQKAYLITAPSGTGKTTHARLWLRAFPDCWILNGDKPILRWGKQGFYACGTPWRGKEHYGTRSCLPLAGIALLTRGEENRIAPAAGDERTAFVMHQVFLPEEPLARVQTLELLDRLLSTVPVYDLQCDMSIEAAQVAWAGMSGTQ